MTGVLKNSLASWLDAHGFGILCIISPRGEHFIVVPADEKQGAAELVERGLEAWSWISEQQLRDYLAKRGLSASDTGEAIQLSREWATTISGSPSVFAASTKAH